MKIETNKWNASRFDLAGVSVMDSKNYLIPQSYYPSINKYCQHSLDRKGL